MLKCVFVKSQKQSRDVQEIAFKWGYEWPYFCGERTSSVLSVPCYIFFHEEDKRLTWYCSPNDGFILTYDEFLEYSDPENFENFYDQIENRFEILDL